MIVQDDVVKQNATYLDLIDAGGSFLKKAEEIGGDFIRLQLREESFREKILPSEDIGNNFDVTYWTDKPIKIYDVEQTLPQSVVVGYANNPINFYIYPKRIIVTPTMLITPKVMKHRWELRTYRHDVRALMADNMVKDLGAVDDASFLAAVDVALVGPGQNVPFSNMPQWRQINGGFSRDAVVIACTQILQATPFTIPLETVVVNNLTWAYRLQWNFIEVGELTSQLLMKPSNQFRMLDTNWLVTIKKNLVPTMTAYLFGPTKFLGKACMFTPPKMYISVRNIEMYEFQAAMEVGATIAHTGAIGKVEFLT